MNKIILGLFAIFGLLFCSFTIYETVIIPRSYLQPHDQYPVIVKVVFKEKK